MQIRQLHALRHLDQAKSLWSQVEALCPDAPPVVRWAWVRPFLDVYGTDLSPVILSGHGSGGEPLGVALIGARTIWRRGLFPVRQLFLNTAGEGDADSVCVEYNRLLCPAAHRGPFARALLGHLSRQRDWDELVLAGFPPEEVPAPPPLSPWRWQESSLRPCHAMDLAALRRCAQSPEQALSRNTRHQIGRSLRLYGGREGLSLQEAGTVPQALLFFEELSRLHQASWTSRGQCGVFGSERFVRFHRQHIERAHPDGVQLLRLVGKGGRTIGVAYNLLDRTTVYYYQSGLCAPADPREKPGLCLHLLAMEHNLRRGRDLYDFMASDARYKQSLSSVERALVWGAFQRPRLRLLLERGAVFAMGRLRRRRLPPASCP